MKKRLSDLKSFIELTENDSKRIRGGYGDEMLTGKSSYYSTYTSSGNNSPQLDYSSDSTTDYD